MSGKSKKPKKDLVVRSNRRQVPTLEKRVLDLLLRQRKAPWSIEELANRLNVGPMNVEKAIDTLRKDGFTIQETADKAVGMSRDVPHSQKEVRIDVRKFKGQKLKFGVTADNHLASDYQRLDVIEALFDIWQEQGVTEVLQLGNIIEGDARFNQFETKARGMEDQTSYLIDHWPVRKGMKTRFITGDDHEGWYIQREGVNIGQYIEQCAKASGRDDLEYLGHMEKNIIIESAGGSQVIRMIHAGGGSAYAISYAPQKIVESLQGGEKPNILLIGHFHKYNVSFPRSVLTIQPGCTQDQSSFMRKKRLEAMVGGVTLEFEMGEDGLFHTLKHEWHPFYDRDFYQKAWKYGHLKK